MTLMMARVVIGTEEKNKTTSFLQWMSTLRLKAYLEYSQEMFTMIEKAMRSSMAL
jgi:hypothetical protein